MLRLAGLRALPPAAALAAAARAPVVARLAIAPLTTSRPWRQAGSPADAKDKTPAPAPPPPSGLLGKLKLQSVAQITLSPAESDKFNRWRLIPTAVMTHLSLGSVFAWSIFNDPLTHAIGPPLCLLCGHCRA